MKKTATKYDRARPVKAIRNKIAELESLLHEHGPNIALFNIVAALRWVLQESETL